MKLSYLYKILAYMNTSVGDNDMVSNWTATILVAADPLPRCEDIRILKWCSTWRWKWGLYLLVEQEGYYVEGEGRGHLLGRMVQDGGRCANMEVQHLRKWGYPDEEEQGVL